MAGMWKRSLVYLGLMEEDEELEEVAQLEDGKVEEQPTRMVRTLRREESRENNHPAGRGVVRALGTQGPPRQVHVVEPRIYDDAQEFADRLKAGVPVIINLRLTELSMGMTDDFETAIEEGATIVRIGTAIFGGRA